jgi:hypothetical protein
MVLNGSYLMYQVERTRTISEERASAHRAGELALALSQMGRPFVRGWRRLAWQCGQLNEETK